jgi:serine protein kinase
MSKNTDGLTELLGLKPLVVETMSFPEFLSSLSEHPERADTAAALFVRAVKSLGEENIDEAHPDRQPYLRMLRAMKIPSYKAFAGVRGSQRVVARLMKFYESAAQNGYQLRQMLVLCGGPGSGKSFLVDHMVRALEGQIIYAVAGCPEHESPMNLLKLLTHEERVAISEQLGMIERDGDGKIKCDKLDDLLKVAQEPCAHCFRSVMGLDKKDRDCKTGCHEGDETHAAGTPNLSTFKVEALRLSSRNAGISVWTPSAPDQGCSLPTAIRQGNRGIVRMQEAFDAKGAEAGSVSQLQVLLEATEGRRMPASAVSCGSSAGFIPLDQMQVVETNEGAWLRFVKDQEDPGKWHRRGQVFVMDYNTAVCEEVAAYTAFIKQLKQVPNLDPLVLQLLATAAVASRMKDDADGGPTLSQRIRMYNGEPLLLEKKSSSINERPNPWLGGAASLGASAKPNEAQSKNYSVSDLWTAAGEDEGRTGIDFGFMLSSVSQLCELGLQAKHQSVSALAAVNYLKARVERELTRPGLSDASKKIFERSKKHLSMLVTKYGTVELIESEYRRLLKAQVLSAFSPDYDARAEDMFRKYHKHAVESGKGKDKVFDDRHNRMLPIDTAHLSKIEGAMGKYGDDAVNFRRSLESEFIELMREAAASTEGEERLDKSIFTWETHPELKKAIKKILDDEIAAKVQVILGDDTNLGEEDRKLRTESIERFDRFGYNEPCRKVALAYFKEFELWK